MAPALQQFKLVAARRARMHGSPPRWTLFGALHKVQVPKKPSTSSRTSVQSALDLHLQQMHWTSGLSRSIIITS